MQTQLCGKNVFCVFFARHLMLLQHPNICQARLGTNIGKVEIDFLQALWVTPVAILQSAAALRCLNTVLNSVYLQYHIDQSISDSKQSRHV